MKKTENREYRMENIEGRNIPMQNASVFLFALILFSAFYFLLPAPSAHAAWYDATYGYCRELTMTAGGNSGGVATTTTLGFALVATSTISTLKTTGNGGNIQSTGTASGTTTPTDLIITNGTECNSDGGSTILDFYFEKYVATTGEFVLWVEPTDVSSTSAKTVLMYYGKSGASDQSDEAGVFGSLSEVGVWNFSENPGGGAPQFEDSTSNTNNGTATGMDAGNSIPAMSDGGVFFSGDGSEYILASDHASLDFGDNFTYALWLRRDADTGTDEVISDKGPGTPAPYIRGSDDHPALCIDSVGCPAESTGTIADTNWHHVVYSKNGSSYGIYLDGANTTNVTGSGTASNSGSSLCIGGDSVCASFFFDGEFDDFRIYNNMIHSMDVLTIYNNTRSSTLFWTFGGEETPGAAPIRRFRLLEGSRIKLPSGRMILHGGS